MSTDGEAATLLRDWLKTASGYEFVRTFVKFRIAPTRAGDLSSIASSLHLDKTASVDEFTEEISPDFLLFILSYAKTKLAGQPLLVAQLHAGKYRYFLELLWQRYVWYAKDKGRLKQENPRGYVYRRFREIVGTEKVFSTCLSSNGQLFYRAGKAEETGAPEAENVLADESYNDYPMVPESLQLDEKGDFRLTGKWLISTAGFFYSLVKEKYPRQHYIAVSELVRYLATVMPWLNRPTRQVAGNDLDSDVENANRTGDMEQFAAQVEDDATRLDRLRQTRTICPLVDQIVACWDRIECCIFAWRLQDIPLTYESIAEKLSLQSHNQAYSLFEKTKRSLKRFCDSWPGPPLHELAPGVAEVFVNKVRQQAKNKCNGS